MPNYNPNKDRFLSEYFDKQGKGRKSEDKKDRKSAKTLPSEERIKSRQRLQRKKLLTLESEKVPGLGREGYVHEISKQ